MTDARIQQELTTKPASRIGNSILPSSEPQILEIRTGKHGTFQVRPLPELDTHGLFFGASLLLATHPNGYSCNDLADRILAAWRGERTVEYAMKQFDFILACGGLGRQRETIEHIARGLPNEHTEMPETSASQSCTDVQSDQI